MACQAAAAAAAAGETLVAVYMETKSNIFCRTQGGFTRVLDVIERNTLN